MSRTEQNDVADQIKFDDRTSDNLHLLLHNISSLNRAIELQSVLKESLDMIQNVMDTEASSLMLIDENSGDLIVSLPTGPVQKEIKGKRIPQGTGVGSWVIENAQSYYSNDVENDAVFGGDLLEGFVTRNIICSPLQKKGGEIFGVLQALNRRNDLVFSDKDVQVFEALADHVSIAIERTQEVENFQQELKEKEIMLTEVHHRIKNNLSTLTALIEMELSEIDDEHAIQVLRKTCSRIASMTEVHNLLYSKGLAQDINLGSYLNQLTQKISDTLSDPSQKVIVELDSDLIQIDADRAMSCGLVMNELLVNAYKHAFKNQVEEGKITINLQLTQEGFIRLVVSDNGTGIGKNFQVDDSESVGSWLIDVLLRRLEANLEINQSEGTSFIIKFKV